MEERNRNAQNKNNLREKVKDSWLFYRPILEEKLTYSEASSMTFKELEEFNAAIDLYAEKIKKASK